MDSNEAIKIPQDISYFAKRDKESLSFYDSFRLSQINPKEVYSLIEPPTDLVTISDEKPFPATVLNAITPFTQRVYFGMIPTLSRFYCIIDNSVHFWSVNPNEESNPDIFVEEESTVISCVSCGQINPNVLDEKECIGVIIYGTDVLMRIIPVSNESISFKSSIEVRLKFIPTAFYTSKSGTIFISSHDGEIYSLVYFFIENTQFVETKITKLTRNTFFENLQSFFLPSARILQLAIDEETQILASLDSESVIRFYKIDKENLEFISDFDPHDSVDDRGYTIVYISSLPLNYRSVCKFVGFYQDGTRICFFADYNQDDVFNVDYLYSYPPPPLETTDNFFTAFLCPSYCVFLYEKTIVITYESHNAHEHNSIKKESYCIIPLNYDILIFSQMIPNLQPTEMSNSPFFWQHLFSPNPGFLITSKGIRTLNFSIPLDKLSKIFDEEENLRISMSKPLIFWAYTNFFETTTTALLLAKKQPHKKDQCINFIMRMTQEVESFKDPIDPHYLASHIFLIRLSRILSLVWPFPLFKMTKIKDDNFEINEGFKINDGFKNPPINYIKEIKFLKLLCDDYFKRLTHSDLPRPTDIDRFPHISIFLKQLIEIFRFIKIITKMDNKVLNLTLQKMDMEQRKRLVLDEFGLATRLVPGIQYKIQSIQFSKPSQNSQYIQSLEDAFHEFAMKLYEVMPSSDILLKIGYKCPQYYNYCDIIVLNNIKIIKEKFDNSDGTITKAVNILINNISRPMNLDEICEILIKKDLFELALKLCMAKADDVDPSNLALHWFLYSRSEADSKGRDAFDERYMYYDIIFNLVNLDRNRDINAALSINDEMFHICFYHFLLDNQELEKILKYDTPFLKSFVQNKKVFGNKLKYLWRYLAAHRQFNESAIELLKYMDNDDDIDIYERIKLLKTGISYSFENNKLKNELKTQLKLAIIQLELKDLTDLENYGYSILSPNDLFIECTYYKYWDFALRIISTSPVQGEKKYAISKLWQNFIERDLSNLPLRQCTAILSRLFSNLDLNSDVANIEIVIPIFENFKIMKKGQNYWAFQLLVKVGYNISSLAKMYFTLSTEIVTQKDLKCSFIDIISYALFKGAIFDKEKALEMKKWFIENAVGYDNYESAIQNFSIII